MNLLPAMHSVQLVQLVQLAMPLTAPTEPVEAIFHFLRARKESAWATRRRRPAHRYRCVTIRACARGATERFGGAMAKDAAYWREYRRRNSKRLNSQRRQRRAMARARSDLIT